MQLTDIAAARMEEDEARTENAFKGFLIANNLLKVFTTNSVRAALFQGMDIVRCQDLGWVFVQRMAALLPFKIVWPANFRETFIATVDGTCTQTSEPRTANLRRDKRNYCKKFNRAGRNHEIAVDLWTSRCIHAKVSDPGGTHDLTAIRQELLGKVPAGKRLIADRGYISFKNNEHEVIAFPNPLDPPELKKFKSEARARHENFNKRLKDYKCLKEVFSMSLSKHQQCFDAVVVLVQYAIEDTGPYGEPLNVLSIP